MFGLNLGFKNLLNLQWQGTLSDYLTDLAWSPTDSTLAASSAAGEVVLWRSNPLTPLQTTTSASIHRIAFSPDGQFLAAGGEDGQVKIWNLSSTNLTTPHTLHPTSSKAWIEHLAWSPIHNQLAYSLGRSLQIWDADHDEITATLNFEASSVLGIQWCPNGQYLAVCGHRGVKVWNAQNWQDTPYNLDIRAASLAIAWSPDGHYLAAGNLDRTLVVMAWNNPDPWIMRGFPGKIRAVNWSESLTATNAPLLAAACGNSIIVWEKQTDESAGWEARVLDLHEGTVQAIAFQPNTFLLASASDDGYVCLWQNASEVAQILEGAPHGFSSLAWHPQGHLLAAGGQNGEVLIWSGD